MDQSPKDKLIETAIRLFARHGFHGVGINRILEESGVAKRTLYRYFSSKDDLVVAVLEALDKDASKRFQGFVEGVEGSPEDQLLAFFDAAYEWFAEKDFFGCLFVSAVHEYSDPTSPVRAVCQTYKNKVRALLQDLSFKAGLMNPMQFGDQLFMLFEGATVMAQVSGNPETARLAKKTARILIETAR